MLRRRRYTATGAPATGSSAMVSGRNAKTRTGRAIFLTVVVSVIELVAHLIPNDPADANATWLGHRLNLGDVIAEGDDIFGDGVRDYREAAYPFARRGAPVLPKTAQSHEAPISEGDRIRLLPGRGLLPLILLSRVRREQGLEALRVHGLLPKPLGPCS
jgi:hypothetical protein